MADPTLEKMGEFMVRHPWLITVPLALVAVVALGFGIANFRTGQLTEARVTKIERSPCQANPDGKECARVRRQTARLEPLSVPCISFRRIVQPRSVYRKFTRCGDFRRERGERTDDTSEPTGNNANGATAPPADPADPDGGSGGGDSDQPQPEPASPPDSSPDPPADPGPAPDPGTPDPPPGSPPPADSDSVLGLGVDVPNIAECDNPLVKGLCW